MIKSWTIINRINGYGYPPLPRDTAYLDQLLYLLKGWQSFAPLLQPLSLLSSERLYVTTRLMSLHIFVHLRVWFQDYPKWYTTCRVIFSYQRLPWNLLPANPDCTRAHDMYFEYFYNIEDRVVAPKPLVSINLKHKIKGNLKIMRGFLRRLFFLPNKRKRINFLVSSLLTKAQNASQPPVQVLQTSPLVWEYLWLPGKTLPVDLTHYPSLVLLKFPINCTRYLLVQKLFAKHLKIKGRASQYEIADATYYLFHLRTNFLLRKLVVFKYILQNYGLPRNLEVDYLTLTAGRLTSVPTTSYIWYGFSLYTWWTFFYYYNWKHLF